MQAAIGCAQLQKLESFITQRNANFSRMLEGLKHLHRYFHLPRIDPRTKPSPFGFMLHVRADAGFTRNDLTTYLEEHNIQTRNLFAGNLLHHPCFSALQEGIDYRISEKLQTTDSIMNNTFWLGVYPGITPEVVNYVVKCINTFVETR
jgi:CDP-6-deoxy-D-xylo-4-hexulose-3-dehydrase